MPEQTIVYRSFYLLASPCRRQKLEIRIVHQTKVFAGATMEFQGAWIIHPKFGRQFKATKAVERKPATTYFPGNIR